MKLVRIADLLEHWRASVLRRTPDVPMRVILPGSDVMSTHIALHDDFHRSAYFPGFPYSKDRPGYLTFEDAEKDESRLRTFSIQLSADYGNDFHNIERFGSRLDVRVFSRGNGLLEPRIARQQELALEAYCTATPGDHLANDVLVGAIAARCLADLVEHEDAVRIVS